MYYIYRFYHSGKPAKLIKTVATLVEAQAHCSDPKTRQAGEWFDGYSRREL